MVPEGLPARLRRETGPLHARAESSPFMKGLLGGTVTREGYALLLRQLHPIYQTLEAGLRRHRTLPGLAPLYMPALDRESALASDLTVWHGVSWPSALTLLPATTCYVQRLVGLERTRPHALAAHSYVRYLGDLSGGQLLRNAVLKGLGPTGRSDRAGLAFYEFGTAQQVRALIVAFRQGLADLTADVEQIEDIVSEARLAFDLHVRLFEELALAVGSGD